MRAIQKAIALIELKFTPQANPIKKPLLQKDEAAVSQKLIGAIVLAPMTINAADATRH